MCSTWVEESQVSGDSIRVKGRGGEIDSLFVRRNAFVAQRDARGRHGEAAPEAAVGSLQVAGFVRPGVPDLGVLAELAENDQRWTA